MGDGRRRAPWWIAAGVATLLAAAWGRLNPTSSLLVHELLDHPVVLGLAGYLLVAWGVSLVAVDAQRRLVVRILLAALGATAFGLIGMVLSVGVNPGRDEVVLPAPAQAGIDPYEADIVSDGDLVSPMTTVVIRHREWGPSARWWPAACLNGEYAGGTMTSARWTGPAELVVVLDGGREVPVSIEPATAEPRAVVRLGRRCGAPSSTG